jgi:protein dithiol oxidoreductase (disulfide-forming)
MNRANVIAVAFAVAAVGGTFSLNACAREAPEAGAKPAASAGPSRPGKWVAGTNYRILGAPQPTNVGPGKVEVIEFFWFGCGHCYRLDPALEKWKAGKPAYIEFRRSHVMWGPVHQQHARLFYVMQALGRPDLQTKIFEEIHLRQNLLAAQNPVFSRNLQQAFFEKNGVTTQAFETAYDSMSVATNLQRADESAIRYAIESVPTIVINGKFVTDVGMAGGPDQLIELVNDLAASERRR